MSTTTAQTTRHPELVKLLQTLDLRANSLIITLFGDTVLPHGGVLSLGSLIGVAREFGISERLVRTGVYRLSQEGWLSSTARGRRSFYAITDWGRAKFEEAQRRIYSQGSQNWDNQWQLVKILPHMSQADRQVLRRELSWIGFGQISPTFLVHPGTYDIAVKRTVTELQLENQVFVFRAAMEDFIEMATVQSAITQAWPLEELETDYRRFTTQFNGIETGEATREMSPRDCFVLRTLLIHDYRRILLKDPQLPDALLNSDWQGRIARTTCSGIYRRVVRGAEDYVAENLESMDTPFVAADELFWQRFGGLPRT